ncbi:polysaccharide deacetylase family protein [Spirulina sp. CCNP1310]|uniref:polysaccharide deacetylase family protein n=1 Tax=Spirulina sp. CCNP1310 TaxID=3110249 RepID=UPI002B219C2C|nr:polysaccharide deacetylase family protein [Spirulina sp. CCNP1310]MEA5418606.1 polysaccharide deacetylase family protein [Spirulina sp. CCNP1310]
MSSPKPFQTFCQWWWGQLRAKWLLYIVLAITTLTLCVTFQSPISRTAQAFVRGPVAYSGLTARLNQLSSLANQAWANQLELLAQQAEAMNFTVPEHFRGKTIRSVPLPSGRKVIALTFDDGPLDPYTNDILYILENNDVKATFFLIGRSVQAFPNRAKHIQMKGHALANHSWSHPYAQQSPAGAAAQIDNTDTWIKQTTGFTPTLFRPPGGILNNGMAGYAAQKGQVVVMWSADSKDYYASAPNIIKRVMAEASPGGIVLFHDGGGNRSQTVLALPFIIKQLREQGYEFVTVPELLKLYEEEVKAINAAKAAETAKAAEAVQASPPAQPPPTLGY